MSNEDIVVADSVVEIHYTLTNGAGEEVDSSLGGDALPYIHGNETLVPGLERELDGKKVGDKLKVTVSPEDGYGAIDPEMTQVIPRDQFEFDGDIEVGMRFEAEAEHGLELVTVLAVDEASVTIDANHPLAGQTLHFDVEIVSVREATEEELEHGHVHSPGGCEH